MLDPQPYPDNHAELLTMLENGYRPSNIWLIESLQKTGFTKIRENNKFVLSHKYIQEKIRFHVSDLDNSAQQNIGKTIRMLRELVAMDNGDNRFVEQRTRDKILKEMGIPPPNRKTVLERIRASSAPQRQKAVSVALNKGPNPNLKGKNRTLAEERMNKDKEKNDNRHTS